jgi:hypothetical protein
MSFEKYIAEKPEEVKNPAASSGASVRKRKEY